MSHLWTCEIITSAGKETLSFKTVSGFSKDKEATEATLISRKLLGAPGQQGAPEGRSTLNHSRGSKRAVSDIRGKGNQPMRTQNFEELQQPRTPSSRFQF